MSGSIGADRIEHTAVSSTVAWFEQNILKPYAEYRSFELSGSVRQPGKKNHGDIDMVIYVEGDNLRDAKKAFEKYLKGCDELVKFKAGKHKGHKVQVYGNVVTCQIPIQGFDGLTVQVDCDLVLSKEEQTFTVNFLNLSGEKQVLVSGLVRVALLEGDPKAIFRKLHIHNVPDLAKNQELEFVLNEHGLILRKITYKDNLEEESREDIWISRDWNNVAKLLKPYDLDEDFDKILDQADKTVKSSRSRHRLSGIVKAGVNISSGEKGTPKGDTKERAINSTVEKMGSLDEEITEPKNTVALYAGGFKPPHKAHFANAKKLYANADRLIIFIGPKLRQGIPVTAEQSEKIWNIYANYLRAKGKPIEIRISKESPVQDVYSLVNNSDNDEYTFLIGYRDSTEEKHRYDELIKLHKNNVIFKKLPVIVDKENNKLSASTLRQSIEILQQGKWIPSCLDRDDTKTVLDILIKPLKDEVIKEGIKNNIKECLHKNTTHAMQSVGLVLEGSSGTPIAPSAILSSENREKLGNFYKELQATYGSEFYIKFSQTFILIKSPDQEKLANLYIELHNNYKNDFVFKNVRDAIQVKTKYKSDWMSYSSDDGSGRYRDVAGNGGFDSTEDQANHWLNEESYDQIYDNDWWAKNTASLIGFMRKEGNLNLDPLPEIILNKSVQHNGLLDKTANYNPVDKIITLYVNGRHPKDVLRSLGHELIHSEQDNEGRILGKESSQITGDKHLEELEDEATRKGYLLFRKWTESLERKGMLEEGAKTLDDVK